MKLAFNDIIQQLNDPFFEIQKLGKEAIRQRTLPVDKYPQAPDHFQVIDWTPEDDSCLIEYSFRQTVIGKLLLANTSKGICFFRVHRQGGRKRQSGLYAAFPATTYG